MSRFIPFGRKNRNSISPNLMTPFNMIDDFIGDAVDSFPKIGKTMFADSFKVDISETATDYIIEAELPDVKQQDIELHLNEGNLTIFVEKREEKEEQNKDKTYIHKERRYSSMERSLYLVDAVTESDQVRAKLEHGLLEVTVPKEQTYEKPNESQRINIE